MVKDLSCNSWQAAVKAMNNTFADGDAIFLANFQVDAQLSCNAIAPNSKLFVYVLFQHLCELCNGTKMLYQITYLFRLVVRTKIFLRQICCNSEFTNMEATLKKIKIQTGVVKRIAKEKVMYQQEATKIEQQVKDMEESGKDEYDIKKRKEVLEESKMMVPDCEKRLQKAIEQLTDLVQQNEELKDDEVYQAARTILSEVQN